MPDMKNRIEDAAAPSSRSGSWYVAAMEHLIAVTQELAHARTMTEITAIVRRAARDLTEADGATFVLRDGNFCFYIEENAIGPLWKGQRFPMDQCISGWVMANAATVFIEDIYKDPRIPIDAYRPTFVKSLVMVPLGREKPIGAIGNYWSTTRIPAQEEIALLESLAALTAAAIENADLYKRLQDKLRLLEGGETPPDRFIN